MAWFDKVLGANIAIALLADRLIGEVSRAHPLVAFGKIANRVEVRSRRLAELSTTNGAEPSSMDHRLRWAGTLSWALLVLIPPVLLLGLIPVVYEFLGELAVTALSLTVLYFCIGMRSLEEHAQAIERPLRSDELDSAREQLSRIVSRDTAHLDSASVTSATIESVLENGSDAVLAPIFWFVVAGAPGALCYRLANTLDAMWGYRNERYLQFGRTAARMDDVLNWLPARCCALSYALVGNCKRALQCWATQAPMWDSPNAGPVMAAGAGALSVRVGGPTNYHGLRHWRPSLGEGVLAEPRDIKRALRLLWRATGLWLLVIVLWELLT